MGFLLFTARKFQLKREIRHNEYEQMTVTSQLQAAAKRTAQFQEQMSQMKQMTSVFAKALQAKATQDGYKSALGKDDDFMARWANNELTDDEKKLIQDSSANISKVQTGASAIASAFSTVTDSIFTAVSNVELEMLKAEETRLQTKQDSLKVMNELYKSELQSYDEALPEAIKDVAPKFGLA